MLTNQIIEIQHKQEFHRTYEKKLVDTTAAVSALVTVIPWNCVGVGIADNNNYISKYSSFGCFYMFNNSNDILKTYPKIVIFRLGLLLKYNQ